MKIELINALRDEEASLHRRLLAVEFLLSEVPAPDPDPDVDRPVRKKSGRSISSLRSKSVASQPRARKSKRAAGGASGWNGKTWSCCGSKAKWRHKSGCRKTDGSLPPDEVTWSCIGCDRTVTSKDKPSECFKCGGTSFVQKPD